MSARGLGALDGAALVFCSVVGVGIFTTPGVVAAHTGGTASILAVWALGGLLSLAGALAYAELSLICPREGGEYVYLRRAFGPLAGFLSGWTAFVAGFSGAIAAGAVGFAAYLGRLFPAAADAEPFVSVGVAGLRVELSPRSLVALGLIVLLSLVHMRGLGPGRVVQNALAALTLLTLGVLVGAGLLADPAPPPVPAAPAREADGAWLLALVAVMFTYSGWNAAAYVAGEVRQPERNVPRALVGGTAAVCALYLLLNLAYVRALSPAGLRDTVSAGDAAARALFGDGGAALFTPLVLLAVAGGVSAMILTGPRIYYAMARDGSFPGWLARTGRGGVPRAAVAAQAAWSCVLVVSGGFEALITYTGFAVVLFTGAAVASLFVLRARGASARPAWGYPLLPAVFVLVSLAMVAHSVRAAPGPSLLGFAVIAAGIPVHYALVRLPAVRGARAGVDLT